MMVRDVVHQRIPVMRERVTVMDLVMVVSMMVTVDVREILCVAVTTVSSLELTIIPRMTVVRNQSLVHLLVGSHLVELDSNQTALASGQNGANAQLAVALERKLEVGTVRVLNVAQMASISKRTNN